jgi:transcriptional regulator with XRE-family HTH domain
MSDEMAARLGKNVRQLRATRGMTQAQMARLSGLPRATWANLESGESNPTLGVLARVAGALQVTIEELIAAEQASARHYPKGTLPSRRRGSVEVRSLLPDRIPGVVMERMDLPGEARLVGVPHTAGTREYFTCEQGKIDVVVGGQRWSLEEGDVVVFRGDQRHSYLNPARKAAVGYSVVMLRPADGLP